MAKPKYQLYLEKIKPKLNTIKGLYRRGYTQDEIAKQIGISPSTLIRLKKEIKELNDALTFEKDEVDFLVENALLKKALEGDTKAQIYWLKNRQRDYWSDNPEEVKNSRALDDLITALEKIKD